MDFSDRMAGYLESVAFQERLRKAALRPQPFVTISRQPGAGAAAAADAIAREMQKGGEPALRDWNILDRRLCETVAADPKLSVSMDSLMRESFRSEFDDYIMHLVADDSPQRSVIRKIFQTIRAAAGAGKVVIVGRAGACVTRQLPLGVHLRLVASKSWRLANLMRQRGCDRHEAEKLMAEMEVSRRRLVASCFQRDIEDPLLYDAVINAERLPAEQIAALAVELVRRKAAQKEPVAKIG